MPCVVSCVQAPGCCLRIYFNASCISRPPSMVPVDQGYVGKLFICDALSSCSPYALQLSHRRTSTTLPIVARTVTCFRANPMHFSWKWRGRENQEGRSTSAWDKGGTRSFWRNRDGM